ncbi:uncharacterized protein LOC131694663 [Topomyia yanbarensis]|uniref:uncharacterized protein LOC131694663 n=1 Tax=Topomyia yanbarensis TaxID=2498891 RepID=UPI00273AF495|nr:uncharacterized protein LOC131694663 [Topomyia yanbarensis]
MVKLRPKLSVNNHVRYRRPPRYDLERLKQPDVATACAQHVEAALPDEEELDVAPLEDCCRTVKAAINNVAKDIVGYEERRRRNDCAVEDGNEPAPTLREAKDAIEQLKNNKAAGKDGIAAELIKLGPEKLATCLHRLVVRSWETEQLPEELKEGVICPFHKKGDHLE